MVFSLFGKRKAPPTAEEQKQLESPSPSASISEATRPPQSTEERPTYVRDEPRKSRSLSRGPVAGPSGAEYTLPPSDPAELLSLLKKVPPKTLHDYVIKHISDASPQEISSLMEFFKALTPPPKLHCVRCHSDFVEIENTDRSCHIPHDDESALVEKVGNVGTTYETLWGCCNKIAEGNGDQGPPDGWCYEGYHTTDVKRARFRADSTLQDDKLVSCRRKRCFVADTTSESRGRSQRTAANKSFKEPSDEEEDYDMRELEREAEVLTVSNDAGRGSRKKPRKSKSKTVVKGAGEETSISAGKPKKKSEAESLKPRSTAKESPSAVNVPMSIPSPQSEVRDSDDVAMVISAPEQEPEAISHPKKKRRTRKSAPADGGKYKPPNSVGESSESDEEPEKPRRKKAKRKSVAVEGPTS